MQFITGHAAIINTQRLIDRFWYANCFTAPEQKFVCSGNDSWNLLNCASTRYDYCQDRLSINMLYRTLNWTEETSRKMFRRLVSYVSLFTFFDVQYVMPKENNLPELLWPYVLKIKVRHIEDDESSQTNCFKLVPFKLFSLPKR